MNQPVQQVKKTILTALFLFIVDAFVMNQGAIAVIAVAIIILWLLPKSIVMKFENKSARDPLTKAAIYGVMVLFVFLANYSNNELARYRAETLILAIEKYHQDTGHYPENLSKLVPAYIPNVPLAKYTVMFNEFRYINQKDTRSLYYVALPPFGRPTYSFNQKSWGYID